jgi:hypothetical protein
LIRELLPPEGPPAELAANATNPAKVDGKGRLAIGGDGVTHPPTPTAPMNRINGVSKNGKSKVMATA